MAAQLLDELIRESLSKGFTQLVLDVYYLNPRAARFYEKHGFVKYNQLPVDEWRESKMPDKFFYYTLKIG